MHTFTTDNKTSLSFRAANQSLRLSTSTPSSMKGKRYMRLHRPLVAHRSHWWPSVIWSGTTIWFPGTVRLLLKMLSPAPAARTTICASRSISSQQQRRELLEFLVGAELLGILWQGYLRCMPSIRQICFPVWAACPALSAFPE